MYDPATVPPPDDQALALAKPLMTNGGRRDPRQGYFDMRGMSEAAYRRVAALYYASITHIDHHVGRILAALETQGQLENTLVIFTSDHGDYMGDYGLILKAPNIPYDALARVPLLVAGPGCSPGRTSDALVSLVDLLPTAAAASGVEVPPFVQGRDLTPLLGGSVGPDESNWWREAVFSETRAVKAVRTRRFKYLYNHRLRIEELYDLLEDPKEIRNLAGDPAYAPVRAEMRERLLAWYLETEWERHPVDQRYDKLEVPG